MSLPPELLEQILFHLDGIDKPALNACSLVSHSFLPIARQSIFRSVNITIESQTYPSKTGGSTVSHFAQLLDLLINGGALPTYIRHIKISATNKFTFSDGDWAAAASSLSRLLPRLTRLHSLSIESDFPRDWTSKNSALRQTLADFWNAPTLQCLELAFVEVSFDELYSFMRMPKLTLTDIDIKVDVTAPRSEGFLDWKFDQPIPLCELTVTLAPTLAWTGYWGFIRHTGPSLKTLQCYASAYHDCKDVIHALQEIHLHSLPSLEHLAVPISLEWHHGNGGLSVERLIDLFSNHYTDISSTTMVPLHPVYQGMFGDSATSTSMPQRKIPPRIRSNLKTIEFSCDFDQLPLEGEIARWRWADLDRLLTSASYAHLERIEVSVKEARRGYNYAEREYGRLEPLAVALIQEYLPRAAERGLVVAGPSCQHLR